MLAPVYERVIELPGQTFPLFVDVAVIDGAAMTTPLHSTFIVAAPVEVNTIFPGP